MKPVDRHLVGMKWRGKVYINMALLFGLRLAPKIFNALADVLGWCLGVRLLFHYLDDFLTIGDAGAEECQTNMDIMLTLCSILGLIVAPENVAGPLSILTFLVIDTIRLQSRLPIRRSWRSKNK